MNTVKQAMLMFLFLISLALPVQATDSAKEQRWAKLINHSLVDGEYQWLASDGQKFLGIYIPAAIEKPVGALILLHGRGMHPDWPQIIQPLRTQFPAKGWATLSLQMPVLSSEAKDKDYVPLFHEVPARIQAGLDFLSKRNINKVILIGHSLGANMATDYLVKHHNPYIKAFIGIGMVGKPQPAEFLPLDNVAALLQIKVPVLDVYGSEAHPDVLASVDRRAYAVYQTGNHHSQQIKINGANHLFQGYETQLVDAITNWMTYFTLPKKTNQFTSTDNSTHSK